MTDTYSTDTEYKYSDCRECGTYLGNRKIPTHAGREWCPECEAWEPRE